MTLVFGLPISLETPPLEIVSGRRIEVTHPNNIMVLPNHQRIHHIEVYQTEPCNMAIIRPEGLAALRFPAAPWVATPPYSHSGAAFPVRFALLTIL